jgi:hypothetical protein
MCDEAPLRANVEAAFTGESPLGQRHALMPEAIEPATGGGRSEPAFVRSLFIARDLTQLGRRARIIDSYPLLLLRTSDPAFPPRNRGFRASTGPSWCVTSEYINDR